MAKSKSNIISKLRRRLGRKGKRTRPESSQVPSAWRLTGDTYRFILTNWRLLGGIVLVFAIFYFLLVKAAPTIDLNEYRSLIESQVGDDGAVKTFALAGVALVGANAGTSQVQLVYGLLMLVVFSLAIIWAIRHVTAGKKFNFRDAFYRSQTPVVPYLSIVMLMTIQLLPFAAGSFIFTVVSAQNIAVGPWENLVFWLLWIGLSLLSAYWLVNSLMASYAVTLPGMYPWAAIKAARKLVQHRRWFLLKKIIFLPLVLFILFAIIFLFLIAVAPATVYWFYDLTFIMILPIIHIYYYKLYRELV